MVENSTRFGPCAHRPRARLGRAVDAAVADLPRIRDLAPVHTGLRGHFRLWFAIAAGVAPFVPASFTASRLGRGMVASGAPCVSRAAAAVPRAYTQPVTRARTIVCDELASRIPGVQVAVAVNGSIVWSEGFGYADLERKVPVTNETQFRIGSVSKPLTAAAVALLYERGTLDLDAPVQRYVPSFPDKGHPITTRQLGGHLAGIRHYRDGEFLLNRRYPSVREGLAIFRDDPLLFPPGTQFSYSSYGWNLISAVVEGASGQDFLTYMRRNVFDPLGLVHTAPDRADSLIPERTHFYERGAADQLRSAPAVDNSYKWAGGGFLSTAEDVVRFGSALLQPGLLKESTLDLLFTSQRTSAGAETGYGIGFFVTTDSLGHRWAFHGGGSVGGTTLLGLDRDSKVVVAITSNLSNAPLERGRMIHALFDQ
jgi:serine beta-lactamase-like protein LACTB